MIILPFIDIGDGIPLILLHGLGSHKEAWNPQFELANKYRLIVPDLRGHGQSNVNNNLTVKNFALDVIKLLEHLDIQSVWICGLSLGGITAQEIYKQRPDLVEGLILANTTSYIPSITKYLMSEIKYKSNNDIQIDRVIHNLEYEEEARNAFYIRDTYTEASKAAIGCNYYPVLLRMDKPVLLIGGLFDRITPVFCIETMRLSIRNVQSVILPCGHLSNIECSEEFNSSVDEFIMGMNK